ncbi:MAG: SPOR domain-containing protein [Bacteroidales bacterium]
MIIGKYIKLLLGEGKRVMLPGFGNLKLKASGNTAAGEGDLMEPPGPRIRFDGGFSKDDGILADAIANGEKIDQEEAKQQVLELVDAIKFALDKGEPYQLHELGSFKRDSDGKVHFRVDPSWILHPEQFGLEPLDLLELDENGQIEDVPQEPVQLTNDEPFAVETERPGPVHRGPSVRTAPHRSDTLSGGEKSQPGRWRAIWIVAGALIIILVVLIMIPADKLNIPGRKPPPPAVTVPEEGSGAQATPPAEEMTQEESDFESLTPERLEEEPAETIEAEPRAAEQNKYFLIAGSFNHLRNASDLQDKLKDKGIDAEVMITENRMYRVSVGSFPTIGEAESELARVKSRPGLESCWILSN